VVGGLESLSAKDIISSGTNWDLKNTNPFAIQASSR